MRLRETLTSFCQHEDIKGQEGIGEKKCPSGTVGTGKTPVLYSTFLNFNHLKSIGCLGIFYQWNVISTTKAGVKHEALTVLLSLMSNHSPILLFTIPWTIHPEPLAAYKNEDSCTNLHQTSKIRAVWPGETTKLHTGWLVSTVLRQKNILMCPNMQRSNAKSMFHFFR